MTIYDFRPELKVFALLEKLGVPPESRFDYQLFYRNVCLLLRRTRPTQQQLNDLVAQWVGRGCDERVLRRLTQEVPCLYLNGRKRRNEVVHA